MTNQNINDVDTITTISSTDRLLVNTDILNNVLEQIEKDDFVADIISTDANNLIEVGTDNKLFSELPTNVTTQGNTFNGNSQLIQTNSSGQYPALDGSLITGVSVTIDKNVTQIGICSTASATAEKAVVLNGFVLATGATIQVAFTNANTATTPTLNVNSTGAKAIYNEAGTAVGANNPAYFPAGSTVEFTYNGTYWVFKKRIIENYINGTYWYRIHSDGWIEQGGFAAFDATEGWKTITLLKQHSTVNYTIMRTLRSTYFNVIYAAHVGIYNSNVTTSSFQVYNFSNYSCYWSTYGY